MKMLAFPLALAAMALAAPVSAQSTGNGSDLSEAQMTALARFAMPTAFRGVQQRCVNILPSNAYIYARGDALTGRLQAASAGQFTQARQALMSFLPPEQAPMAEVLAQLPPESLEPLMREMIAAKIVSDVDSQRCSQINRALELLDPLPPENLAELLAFALVTARDETNEEARAN